MNAHRPRPPGAPPGRPARPSDSGPARLPRLPRLRQGLAGLASALALWTVSAPLSAQGAGRGAEVTVNFVNAEIEAVTRAMGAMMGRQILVDPRVKGQMTVYSDQPVPVQQAYTQYLSALRGLGFAVIETSGLLKVVPEADAKLQAGTVTIGPGGPKGDQIITQVFQLNHENPNNLVAVLRPLISPNNTINANPGNRSLVITDYASNLARMAKIIAALDQPAGTDFEVVTLKHAVASDVAALVQKLTSGGGGAVPGAVVAGGSNLTVMVDPRTNALIVRTGSQAQMASVRSLITRLDQPSVGGPAGQIHVVYLKNADAAKLASVLRAAFGSGAGGGGGGDFGAAAAQQRVGIGGAPANPTQGGGAGGSTAATSPVAASPQPSTGGFIQADPATNSLVITAPEPLYRQIRAVIDQLDGRRAQVFVESMIVEMDAQKAAEFGFQWQGLLGKAGDRFGVIGGTNFGSGGNNLLNLSISGAAAAGGTTTGTATGSASLPLPGSGLNVGLLQRINGIYTLGALARFLETVSGTNILSTPNLVALDNEEAKIVVGQNVPFVTGSFTNTGASGATVNPFQTVERRDVGLTLRIRPQIGEGGVVRMSIYQENSSVLAGTLTNSNGPTTSKSALESTVVADDGQIMVLGGQLKEAYSDGENKVPFLGDAPFVGSLFRNESRQRSKSVLLVFLRPVVLRDALASTALTVDRYESIRASQQAVQPSANPVLRIGDSPVLPPLDGNQPARQPAAPAPGPVTPAPARPPADHPAYIKP